MGSLYFDLPEEEWRRRLTPEQYRVLREKGTEPPFYNDYWDMHDPGMYMCAACGHPLFSSKAKYDSGSCWPSFLYPLNPDAVRIVEDVSDEMIRDEVTCAECGSHLGHVFNDGPQPLGQRYCMNSTSLVFVREPVDE